MPTVSTTEFIDILIKKHGEDANLPSVHAELFSLGEIRAWMDQAEQIKVLQEACQTAMEDTQMLLDSTVDLSDDNLQATIETLQKALDKSGYISEPAKGG